MTRSGGFREIERFGIGDERAEEIGGKRGTGWWNFGQLSAGVGGSGDSGCCCCYCCCRSLTAFVSVCADYTLKNDRLGVCVVAYGF